MALFSHFIQRYRFKRLMRRLNKLNLFQKMQEQLSTVEELQDLRWRQANKHHFSEWKATTRVIDMHETGPDTDAGRAFLEDLEAADIHYLAEEIYYAAHHDEDWAMRFVAHPKCDLGTAWLLFLGSGTPMIIEAYIQRNADTLNPFGIFKADVARNDAILARMVAEDFSSRDFLPRNPGRIRTYRDAMQAATIEGHRLRWPIPDDAFKGLKGKVVVSRFEKNCDTVYKNFKRWVLETKS